MMRASLLLILILSPQETVKDPFWLVREVGDGERLSTRTFESLYESKQVVAALEIDCPGATKGRVVRAGATEKTSAIAKRAGANVVVAAGYFDAKGDPAAPLKVDGNLLSKGLPAWPAVAALCLGGEKEKIHPAIRRIAKEEDLKISRYAVGGILLVEAKKAVDGLDGDAWPKALRDRQARMLAGVSEQGKRLHLVAVQGGDGFTLAEAARFLIELGCETAMAIGGGDAVSIWIAAKRDGIVASAKEEGATGAAIALEAPVVVIVDNTDPDCKPSGEWKSKNEGKGFVGKDYLLNQTGKGSVDYTPHVPIDGVYEIFLQYPVVDQKLGNISASIETAKGNKLVASIGEFKNGGQWFSLGVYELRAGEGKITINIVTLIGYGVVVDALRLRQKN